MAEVGPASTRATKAIPFSEHHLELTITDATGAEKKTTSNGEGVYTLTGLAPGKYVLEVAAFGSTCQVVWRQVTNGH